MLSKRKAELEAELAKVKNQAELFRNDNMQAAKMIQQEHEKYAAEVQKVSNLEAQMQQLIEGSNELVNHHNDLLNQHAELKAELDNYIGAKMNDVPPRNYAYDEVEQGSTLEFDLIVEQKEPESTFTAVECLGGWAGVIRFDGEIIWQSEPFVAQWMALQASYEQYKKAKSKSLRLAR